MSRTGSEIMEVIIRSPGCTLDEIVFECNGLTWNQIFTELDRMSRCGQVHLTPKGHGIYSVTANASCQANVPTAAQEA